jgi:hypothetical protein
MDISLKHFSKRDDLVTRSITGETIIVPIQGLVGDLDGIYTLNEVGTTVWDLIDGKVSVGQIVDAVRDEYDVPPDEAERDVIELIGSLEEAGLICGSDEG